MIKPTPVKTTNQSMVQNSGINPLGIIYHNGSVDEEGFAGKS
jgi:hypothetical protein